MKNIDQLIREYYRMNPNGHYFDPDTLKFFGESRSTMRLLKDRVLITDSMDEQHECYVISKLSKNFPTGQRRTYAYFDIITLEDISPKTNF